MVRIITTRIQNIILTTTTTTTTTTNMIDQEKILQASIDVLNAAVIIYISVYIFTFLRVVRISDSYK